MNVDHLTLVLADKSDFTFYHSIKSESQSIYWSGFNTAPDRTRLLEHYTAMLNNENRDIYILKGNNVRIGYFCVDKDCLNNTVEISYGVSAKYAGCGLAKIMINLDWNTLNLCSPCKLHGLRKATLLRSRPLLRWVFGLPMNANIAN